MKFSIAVNMDRFDLNQDMREVVRQRLELVQIADQGGFDIAWTAEHHSIEVAIAPNPFTLLTYWGQHTSRIRLGTAVVSAPYWRLLRARPHCSRQVAGTLLPACHSTFQEPGPLSVED